LSPADLDTLEALLGHRFADRSLLLQAVTHRSAGPRHNERLEFLGDSIVGMLVAERLYRTFPEASEGELTRMRARLVRKDTLAEVARQLGLGDYLVLGGGESRSGGHQRGSILADTLEALVGALWLEAGFDGAAGFLDRCLEARIAALHPDQVLKDNKTLLQERLQRRSLPLPVYELASATGADHDRTFAVECVVDGLGIRGRGTGSSRRKAEQDAAGRVLEIIDGRHGR
jgi:ribonuclease-3